MKTCLQLVTCLAFLAASPAYAATIQFSLMGKGGPGLQAGNETSAVIGSTGTGGQINGGITFDDVTKVLTLNIGWGMGKGFINLSGNATGAALYGPTASSFPASYEESGNLLVSLNAAPFTFVASASGGGLTGNSMALNATNEAALLAGKLYLNISTTAHKTGEIRANLVPVTPTVPASLIVTTNADSGTGSLRAAIVAAAASPGADTITFDPHVFTGGARNTILLTRIFDVDSFEPSALTITNVGGGVTIDASALSGGITLDGGLGGFRLFNVDTGTLTLRAITLTHGGGAGIASLDGAAIYNGSGNLTLERCTLHGNRAGSDGNGGAIYNGGGTATLTNCTLANNESGTDIFVGSGGALCNRGTATLTSCTLTGNASHSGYQGGGIYNDFSSALTLTNTVIAGNTSTSPNASGGADLVNQGTMTFTGANFVGAGISNPIGAGSTAGPAPLTGDAMLGPLADNGGTLLTVMPRPGSPCIDPTGGATSSVLTTDQRGQPRLVDGDQTAGAILDIGAVEAPAFSTANSIAFATASRTFYEEAGTVQVTVIRSGYAGAAASVQVTSTPGSATLADYTAVSATVNFAAGEVSKTVDVTLTADPLTTEPNESFTLTLSNATGSNTTLGAQTTCAITIIDAFDAAAPTLTVISPVSNAVILEAAGPVVNVTGSATDNQGLAAVQVSLNGSPFVATQLTLAPNGKTGTFQQNVNLTSALPPVTPYNIMGLQSLGGTHTLAVRSVDTRGNCSKPVTRTVTFRMVRPLTISVNDSQQGTVTAGYLGTTDRNVGQLYTITAKPKAGFVFAGWTLLGTPYSDLPTLNFIMFPAVAFQANFVASPFTAGIIGTYSGLASSVGATLINEAMGVLQNANVTNTGAFTATLKIDGLSLPVKGTFDYLGHARFGTAQSTDLILPRAGKSSLIFSLNLDVAAGTSMIGRVRQRVYGQEFNAAQVNAGRIRYSGTNSLPAALAGSVSKPYTLTITSTPTNNGLSAPYNPQGSGYMTATISANGTVTYTGKLADNTAISGSTAIVFLLGKDSIITFNSLYGGRGAAAGLITLADADATHDDLTGFLAWGRPRQPGAQWYPDGWERGISVPVHGNRFDIPPASPARSVFPDLQATIPNLVLTFTGGLLSPSPLNLDQTLTTANVMTSLPVATGATMTVTKATGLVTGVLPHTDGTKPAYQGVIQSKGTLKGASGFFMSTSPRVVNGLGETGSMRAVAK